MGAGQEVIKQIELAAVDKGFRRTMAGIHIRNLWTAAGLVLTGATAPTFTISSHAPLVTWAASSSVVASIYDVVPMDFSTVTRELKLRISMKMGGATDTPTVSVAAYARTPGGALKGPFTATASAALSNTETLYTFDFTGLLATADKIEPGDDIIFEITPGAHTTDTLILSAIRADYRGVLANAVFATRGA